MYVNLIGFWGEGGGGSGGGGIKTVFGEHTYCTTEENYVSISLITCIFAFSFAYMETLFLIILNMFEF